MRNSHTGIPQKTLLIQLAILLSSCAPFNTPATDETILDQQIGQMLMVGFRGLDVNEDSTIIRDIKQYNLGGVILFDYDVPTKTRERNISSPDQLRKLTAKLQSASPTTLIIAVDQEGGKVARLKQQYGFEKTLSAQQLGSADNLDLTRKEALKTATILSQMGINLNLAPAVDLNTNPQNPVIGKLERSYSADPAIVTRHAGQFIKAHRDKNILCALKHFPGHGSSTADSHLGLTDVTQTWNEIELKPYENLIDQGLADVIMTAHVFNAKLDPDVPATLSKLTITGLLRNKLGYKGVVISDDMQMQAIRSQYGYEAALTKAINAGIDIILIANNSAYDDNIVPRTIAIIKKLINDGKISRASIIESYSRIQQLKQQLQKPERSN